MTTSAIPTLPVVFRKKRGKQYAGELTAVFPTLPHDYAGRYMTCYAPVGQHGACDWEWYRTTVAASPAEYESLLKELRAIYGTDRGDGCFSLRVVQRITPAMRRAFTAEVESLSAT